MPVATTLHPPSPRRARLGALLVAGLVVFAAACGTPAPTSSDLSAALVDSGISKKVADCAAAALVHSLSKAELEQLAERGGGGAPVDDPAKKGESADKLAAAMEKCRQLNLTIPTGTTTTTTTSDLRPDTGGASTTVPQGAGGPLGGG